jgi:hypothetical protein
LPFLEDLAGCRAVISTAGNQLIGVALYLCKPVCVMPEACVECVEQRLNAGSNIGRNVRDGGPEAVEILEQFLRELVPCGNQDINAGLVEAMG